MSSSAADPLDRALFALMQNVSRRTYRATCAVIEERLEVLTFVGETPLPVTPGFKAANARSVDITERIAVLWGVRPPSRLIGEDVPAEKLTLYRVAIAAVYADLPPAAQKDWVQAARLTSRAFPDGEDLLPLLD